MKLKRILKNPLLVNLLTVGLITIIVKITGFYKELVIGSTFGLSEFLDTFALAILIPSFIENVFVGALSNIFIPNYIIEEKTSKQTSSFQSLIVVIITSIALFFTITILLFNNFLLETMYPNHSPSYYSSINIQLYILLPCLFFWGYSSFMSALLEIKGKFLQISISPLSTSIATLIAILCFKDVLGNKVIAVGVLSGAIIEFLYLFIMALRYKAIKFSKIILNNNMVLMLKQLPPKVVSGLLTGVNPFVDQIFAAQLVAGSVIALSYGNKIPAFGVSIVMVALGKVLLPHFSKLVIQDIKKAFTELFKILKWLFLVAIVITVVLIYFSHNIIELLFERKEFTAEDTFIVATLQQILLIHVPFYIITRVLVKFLTSINKNAFMAWVSFVNLIVNLVMNYILIKIMGVYGLALSTTIVLIVSSSIYFWFTYKEYKAIK